MLPDGVGARARCGGAGGERPAARAKLHRAGDVVAADAHAEDPLAHHCLFVAEAFGVAAPLDDRVAAVGGDRSTSTASRLPASRFLIR